jgi:hypothetical protein
MKVSDSYDIFSSIALLPFPKSDLISLIFSNIFFICHFCDFIWSREQILRSGRKKQFGRVLLSFAFLGLAGNSRYCLFHFDSLGFPFGGRSIDLVVPARSLQLLVNSLFSIQQGIPNADLCKLTRDQNRIP